MLVNKVTSTALPKFDEIVSPNVGNAFPFKRFDQVWSDYSLETLQYDHKQYWDKLATWDLISGDSQSNATFSQRTRFNRDGTINYESSLKMTLEVTYDDGTVKLQPLTMSLWHYCPADIGSSRHQGAMLALLLDCVTGGTTVAAGTSAGELAEYADAASRGRVESMPPSQG